ncbi:P22 phage major capsid protein family protein [Metaclostridioides mangenotii]|uniref:P22 phage major capsid protein family protein n=1 Tax=Metaclostridioides mangenotii TaxID=1540 RepID=UPI0026EEBDE7|nr:P22 phage major capsid protein family protein [Clostridioides mangenotii]
MAITTTTKYKNFIPTIWSARLLANLDKTFIYPMCVNRDYEGEIKNFGDTVKVNMIGNIQVKDYNGTLEDPEEIDSEQRVLTIDQAKYFNFKVDDIGKVQSNVKLLDATMKRAAVGIGDVIDQHLASFTEDAELKIGTTAKPIEVNKNNAYDTLVDLKVAFNKKNVPKDGRFIVITPEFLGMLEKDDRFTRDKEVLANGVVGNVAGFDLRESNNVPQTAGKYSMLAGTLLGISYAGQIAEIEPYRMEKSFADAVKGLYVYGAKMMMPEAMACVKATFTSSDSNPTE